MAAKAPIIRKKGAPPVRGEGLKSRSVLAAGPTETPPPSAPTTLIGLIVRWRKAPWLFARECLGVEPDHWQDEFLYALVGLKPDGTKLDGPHDMLCLKACKGPGKTAVLSWGGLWFTTCFEDAKILCTSITAENLRDGLWTEFAFWINKSALLKELLTWQVERIYVKERPETWYISARTWPKDADKTKQANTLAGFHAPNTMLIVDEGGDIPEGVVAAGIAHHSTQGKSKEYHYTLMAGNPTRVDGALGVACTRDRAKWWVKEITGDPSDPKRAKRIDIKWAQEQIETWGADNPWVLVNVFGKFPPTQSNKLLGPEQVRLAITTSVHELKVRGYPKIMALDVARSLAADRSVLCRRQGGLVHPFKVWRIDDLMVLAAMVIHEYNEWPADVIFVDMVGLGSGVLDRLRELRLPVIGINWGLPSADKRFADQRTETWWKGHLEIKGTNGVPNISLPDIPELVAELTAPEIEFNDRGRIKLQSKEKLKKNGFASPDIADALMMTWAQNVPLKTDYSKSTMEQLQRVDMCQSEFDPFNC